MYSATDANPALAELARRQCGVVRRSQLRERGAPLAYVRAQLDAQRWTAMGEEVVLLQNAAPTRRQLMWIAVLDAGLCALGSHTSLELVGFRSFAQEAEQIHLVIPRGDRVTRFDGVVVHESRRLRPGDILLAGGLPRTPTARSVLDAAAWQPFPRFAATMVAAAVQQRVTTAAELERALAGVGRIRHKQVLRETIGDVAGGAEALGELDLTRLCRRFGLAEPARQRRRRDASGGWRFLDAEWELPSGEHLVLEVDGSQHMDAAQWESDIVRERSIVVGRKRVLRATNYEVRHDPEPLVRDLLTLGVPSRAPSCQSYASL
jgi:hypothetical protein